MAAASTSMASAAVFTHRLPAVTKPSSAFFFSPLPPRRQILSAPVKGIQTKSSRSSRILVKASSSDESSVDPNELLTDLKEKWDAVENKTTVVLYGGGAVVAIWLASTVVGALNSVPLLPKIMELVGLGYTGWFVYRYLLYKSSRKELAADIEAIKKKIAGTE